MEPWETWSKTCGPIPGFILTHTQPLSKSGWETWHRLTTPPLVSGRAPKFPGPHGARQQVGHQHRGHHGARQPSITQAQRHLGDLVFFLFFFPLLFVLVFWEGGVDDLGCFFFFFPFPFLFLSSYSFFFFFLGGGGVVILFFSSSSVFLLFLCFFFFFLWGGGGGW